MRPKTPLDYFHAGPNKNTFKASWETLFVLQLCSVMWAHDLIAFKKKMQAQSVWRTC